jgi:hypothetical protein
MSRGEAVEALAERPTLAAHGLWYRLNFLSGQPHYDDDGEIDGYYTAEPQWREEDLTPADEAEVQRLVDEYLAAVPTADPLWVRWMMLEWDGVEHFHRKGRPLIELRPAYGYECAMCKAYVVAKDPGDARFRGGPVDGRWIVVPSDSQTWMFPVPRPLSIAMDGGDLRPPTITSALHERGRDGSFYYRPILDDEAKDPATPPESR